jgi:hypothetical protein
MTETTERHLSFGYTAGLPETCTAAWGARLIWPADLLWDRQGSFGVDNKVKALQEWLNGGPLKAALAEAQRLSRTDLRSSDDREVVLYDDEVGTIIGNPNGSHGYFYIAGWRHEDA